MSKLKETDNERNKRLASDNYKPNIQLERETQDKECTAVSPRNLPCTILLEYHDLDKTHHRCVDALGHTLDVWDTRNV